MILRTRGDRSDSRDLESQWERGAVSADKDLSKFSRLLTVEARFQPRGLVHLDALPQVGFFEMQIVALHVDALSLILEVNALQVMGVQHAESGMRTTQKGSALWLSFQSWRAETAFSRV